MVEFHECSDFSNSKPCSDANGNVSYVLPYLPACLIVDVDAYHLPLSTKSNQTGRLISSDMIYFILLFR